MGWSAMAEEEVKEAEAVKVEVQPFWVKRGEEAVFPDCGHCPRCLLRSGVGLFRFHFHFYRP